MAPFYKSNYQINIGLVQMESNKVLIENKYFIKFILSNVTCGSDFQYLSSPQHSNMTQHQVFLSHSHKGLSKSSTLMLMTVSSVNKILNIS